jgi:O-antigen/teichoic acid export membrane protein
VTDGSGGRRNHAALIASQLASGAGSLLLLLVTARALGADGRGVFSFFLLWPMLGGYLLSLGVPAANLQLVAEDPRRAPALFGNTLAVAAAVALATAVPLLLGPPDWLIGPMSIELAWIAWLATAVMVVFQGLTWLQMGQGRYVMPSLLRGVFPAAAAAGFGVLILLGGSDWETTIAAASAFTASVGVVTLGVAASLVRAGARPALDPRLARTSLSFAARYQGGLIAQLVTYRADQWVLGLSQPSATLGTYSVAVSVSEVATYASSAKGMTRFRESAARLETSAHGTIAWVAASTAVSAVLIAAAAAVGIPLLFGSDFDDALGLTLLLLPGTLGIGLMRVCGNDLAGRGRPALVSAVALVQAALMVPAFAVFVPSHGANAAAIISSAGYLLGGAAVALLLIRETAARPRDRQMTGTVGA